jgi:hypothetical protein
VDGLGEVDVAPVSGLGVDIPDQSVELHVDAGLDCRYDVPVAEVAAFCPDDDDAAVLGDVGWGSV